MTESIRLARHTPVSACQSLLEIEPLLVDRDEDLLVVMRRSAAQPETRLVSGTASAIIDNIPYTATMIPVVQQMSASGLPIEPLWWSLAQGACLGGNATIVGASANVVVANMAGRAGHAITFRAFLPYGLLVAFVSLAISSAYLYVRYLG